jgi:NAD(P)-dependent dehydrogenase (short-subunit alcohol dehydrogenase family)
MTGITIIFVSLNSTSMITPTIFSSISPLHGKA